MVLDAARGRILEVEHVGSTAVAPLASRPIVDLAARLDPQLLEETDLLGETIERMLGLNYGQGEAHLQLPGTVVLRKPRRGPATHHLYLATDEGAWASLLAVRDQLRASGEERRRYGLAKEAATSSLDPHHYRDVKAAFFAALFDRTAS
jgi:GrpB-like predicted nucleotidyltransferase (UPF0157 family)